MYNLILILILLNLSIINTISIYRYEYVPKMPSDKVNEGLWVKNKKVALPFTKPRHGGSFIFRGDADNLVNNLQNDFYQLQAHGDMEPMVTHYIQRARRSLENKETNHLEEKPKKKNKRNCCSDQITNEVSKSGIISKLRPASILNEFPHLVAALLGIDNKKKHVKPSDKSKMLNEYLFSFVDNEDCNEVSHDSNVDVKDLCPYASHADDFDDDHKRKIENREIRMKDKMNDQLGDNMKVYEMGNMPPMYEKNAPYKFIHGHGADVPKTEEPPRESSMVKIFSILTSTIKNIMTQHDDLKKSHNDLLAFNNAYVKNCSESMKLLKQFTTKYNALMNYSNELIAIEKNLTSSDDLVLTKEKELLGKLVKFDIENRIQEYQNNNSNKRFLNKVKKENKRHSSIFNKALIDKFRTHSFGKPLKVKDLLKDNIRSKPSENPAKFKQVGKSMFQDRNLGNDITRQNANILFSIPVENVKEREMLSKTDAGSIDNLLYKYYMKSLQSDEVLHSNYDTAFVPKQAIPKLQNTDKYNVPLIRNKRRIDYVNSNLKRSMRFDRMSVTKMDAKSAVTDRMILGSDIVAYASQDNDIMVPRASHYYGSELSGPKYYGHQNAEDLTLPTSAFLNAITKQDIASVEGDPVKSNMQLMLLARQFCADIGKFNTRCIKKATNMFRFVGKI